MNILSESAFLLSYPSLVTPGHLYILVSLHEMYSPCILLTNSVLPQGSTSGPLDNNMLIFLCVISTSVPVLGVTEGQHRVVSAI